MEVFMANIEMGKTYSPSEFEEKIYKLWEDNGCFIANAKSEKPKFSIVLPPPNITAQLHMGHAFDHTLQDVLCRFKRMTGHEVLWLPGTDHASIATEVKVWDAMREEGIDVDKVSREEFLKRANQWKEKYVARITKQMKRIGNSCDWSRQRFTMDEGCNKAVNKYFVENYEKGLIYKGSRMINWCVGCGTSISDAEVEHEEKEGNFYHLKYMIKGTDEFLEIATTRPETLLGDTAVAVNPTDERFKDVIGKTVIVPIVNREVPVVADAYVDLETGTGALKITPSHDVNDYAIGERHDLESICVISLDGTMNENADKYQGMTREQCRKEIVSQLKDENLLVKIVPHNHNVGTCYRCHKVVEPMVSEQWFMNMDEVAKRGLDILNKEFKFVPQRFEKIYVNWLEGIRDWCISRQLWWGHRIPAYYCDDCNKTHVALEMPKSCSCGSSKFTQDEDVLDTWFSSALWPFSTMGYPEKTDDLEAFYPTNVLVTGYDIIFFWVARMVFAGLSQTDKAPFDSVLIHGLVRDEKGRKMSKSLGNGIDPLEVIDKYGADALRFMLITGNTPGNDQRFQFERVEAARNFANKLWNASRFVIMGVSSFDSDINSDDKLTLSDKWILTRLDAVSKKVFDYAEKLDFGAGGDVLYDFVWNEYCDWYIETSKIRLYGEDENAKKTAEKVLMYVLKKILKLLEPFMPFITEEINSLISDNILMNEVFEPVKAEFLDENAVNEMQVLMDAIRSMRNARNELDVPPSKKAKAYIYTKDYKNCFAENSSYLIFLASCNEVIMLDEDKEPEFDNIVAVTSTCKIYIPSDDIIDYKKEFDRLSKEKVKLDKEISRLEKKLSNKAFTDKAPQAVVDKENEKLENYQKMMNDVLLGIKKIESKL